MFDPPQFAPPSHPPPHRLQVLPSPMAGVSFRSLVTTALLLLYYCCTTDSVSFYCCFYHCFTDDDGRGSSATPTRRSSGRALGQTSFRAKRNWTGNRRACSSYTKPTAKCRHTHTFTHTHTHTHTPRERCIERASGSTPVSVVN